MIDNCSLPRLDHYQGKRGAGWRVTTITADTPLTTAWERLRGSSGLLGAPGHENGRFRAGADR